MFEVRGHEPTLYSGFPGLASVCSAVFISLLMNVPHPIACHKLNVKQIIGFVAEDSEK